MGRVRGGKATRPDDGRLSANRPPPKNPPKPKSRYQQLVDGTLKPEDLDDEEVARGRTKDKNGGFGGRPPEMLPRALSDALRMEFQKRTQQKFDAAVNTGYETLLEIARNQRASSDSRVKAATYLIERGVGKVPDKVQQEVIVKKFEEDVEGLFVDDDELASRRAARESRTA